MSGRIKIIKNEKYKFIDPAFLELFKDAGWSVPDKQAIKKQANAKYRQVHKTKIKEAKKKNRQKHPEQQAARNKRYYEKHKAQLKEYYKNYFKQPEYKIHAEKID